MKALLQTRTLFAALLFCCLAASLSSCRYVHNRAYDFADIIQLGGGITAENSQTGMLPPALGLYAQATEFVNFGAIVFGGYSAEWDGRGFFAGPEQRMRLGFLPFQKLKISQDYIEGSENYFKKENGLWTRRMNSGKMRWWNKPAKELDYTYWSYNTNTGWPIMHRGWQYWENFAIEGAICEPFLTHLGFTLRAGFDPSEISDFLLGFILVDFKRDDMNKKEYEEFSNGVPSILASTPPKPASDAPAK